MTVLGVLQFIGGAFAWLTFGAAVSLNVVLLVVYLGALK